MKGKGSNNNYMAKHDQLYHLIECNDHGFQSKCGDNQTLKITGDHMIFQHHRPWSMVAMVNWSPFTERMWM